MKPFMDEHFLLHNDTAIRLYHDYAAGLPIIDYHCHLDPREIAENKRFANLTEAWLYGDHYKWRAMRANGVEEKYVTGGQGAEDYDRFLAWTRTVPAAIGNPLYHWSHLELRRMFGVDDLIHEGNARIIWDKTKACFDGEGYSVRDLIRNNNVAVICTTDDPADSLEHHEAIRSDEGFDTLVLPSFRPDKALNIGQGTFLPWIRRMEEAIGSPIGDYGALLEALESRISYFHERGCRISDHALDEVPYAPATLEEASAIFAKALKGERVSKEEENGYKTATLLQLGRWYSQREWAMQLHLHASRNNNGRMFAALGPDTGYDSIGDGRLAGAIVGLLDAWDREGALPRTILYSLNPKDNDVLASIIGSFQGGGIPGKIQLGSAWWFNDTKDGMVSQMTSLANMGLLGRFVGMLTDSRSFLSFTRHEYFRRILCNMLGEWVERGEAPHDLAWLGGIVQDIGYRNAERYFRFGSGSAEGSAK
ncbi:glucuronate isomerase [Cohnella endophytica]|uniref:Uronate isomerase n=1 Tax=Cohnella endophytica TaxID=2419778 RepID=A0A494YAL4_9BACL|nr:glucuronate isomerase [Cohnella endophytica]RKP57318.1 glucuronate isomerase [Cohnella endophytica]